MKLAARVRLLPLLLLLALGGGPRSARADLLKQLDDDAPEQRAAAARQLGQQDEPSAAAVDKLLKMAAEDPEPQPRAAACEALGRLRARPADTIPVLIRAAADEGELSSTETVQDYASDALRQFGAEAAPFLKEMLGSGDEQRIYQAGFAIEQLGPLAAGTTEPLIELLDAEDGRSRLVALNSLMRIGPAAKQAVPRLIESLDHEDFHTRYWSCRALGAMGEHALPAVDRLLELMEDDLISVRRHAASALGDIGPRGGEKVVDALVTTLRKRNYFLQEQAVIALGKLSPLSRPAKKDIEEMMEQPWFRVRAQAARTLWQMDPGNETAVAVLLGELNNPQAPYDAAVVLGDIGAEMKVAPQVAKALKSDSELVRQCAADALGRMGRAAAGQKEALQESARSDPDPEVRAAAAEALDQIDSDRPERPAAGQP